MSFGSNLNSKYGNRIRNIEIAKILLLSHDIKIIKRSRYFESISYPDKNDPKFINCIIKISTKLKPTKLLDLIFKIEQFLGRERSKKNEPRVCDIDIIDYNGELIKKKYKNNHLIVPHKHAHKRSFVLLPLLEICPNWTHPKLKKNIKMLINSLNIKMLNSIKKI